MNKSYITCKNFDCIHAFSTRLGGISNEEFSSLNLGFDYGDAKDCVNKNWSVFADATGIPIDNLIWTKQVHQNKIKIVTKKDAGDKTQDHLIGFDGLITKDKNVTLCIFTADCAPLLLHDKNSQIIGAIHCGWRPICADIINNAIETFKKLGAKTENISAAIGPCIGPCCFEVGKEVVDAFTKLLGKDSLSKIVKRHKGQTTNVNLQAAIEQRLTQLGVQKSNINKVEECTSCHNEKYFSFRKQNGKCGRMANVIRICN